MQELWLIRGRKRGTSLDRASGTEVLLEVGVVDIIHSSVYIASRVEVTKHT